MSQTKTDVVILIDTSYWIFYRYFAVLQWWRHAKPDNELPENPYDNQEFLEKFEKTFQESLTNLKKKLKLHKQRGKPEINCKIVAARDCPRSEIWRNRLYKDYKGTRERDDKFMGGPFFKHIYKDNNKLLLTTGVDFVLQNKSLEADDVIAITKKYLRDKSSELPIYIIANDHDYLQLLDDKTEIYNFQNKNLRESQKVFPEADKNLFFKIVLGDKSDNIMPVFKKCGPKTCLNYYNDKNLFNQQLNILPESRERYILNETIISFKSIPQELQDELLINYKDILEKI